MSHKALFLDRDGVINIDYGHVYEIEKFDFVPGIFELCKAAIAEEYIIVVVTNQAGIAKGYYSEEEFHKLNDYMCAEFRKRDIEILKTFYCPNHKDGVVAQYKKDCYDRKPNPGLLISAAKEYDIDFSRSVMIGDKCTDMQAAENAGVAKKVLYGKESCGVEDILISSLKDKKLKEYLHG